jgi:NAD(P)-dependent dehydrogenase (short-subunit alcohol dehydrogenase family)
VRFAGEVAVVTGASRGIGRATAERLAAEGAMVVAAARDGAALAELARRSPADRIRPIACDVSRPDEVAPVFELAAGLGGCSILVAAAGVLTRASVEETTDEVWSETVAVNLTGAFRCARAAFAQMRARGGGRIVLISSLSGVYGTEKFPGLLAYNASKHGVVGLVEGLAVEGREHGISALCLSPGAVDTEMLRRANPDLRPGLVPGDVAELIADLLDGPIRAASGANIPLFSNR